MFSADRCSAVLAAVRARSPLVHNITNYVVMNNTANALLALGASPAMVHAIEEVEEFVALSQSLVVNIGTLSTPWIRAMQKAADAANARHIPWVLDPVGAGATTLRTETAADLARQRPACIRGNASEILVLAGATAEKTKGVDSTRNSTDALAPARELAQSTGAIVAVTGPVDYVTDGAQTIALGNGHPLMARVTGLGCTATALVGAALAVEADRLVAVASGLSFLALAGEIAAEQSPGPGSLQLHLLDALHRLDVATIARRLKIVG
ncbi:MAG TPA: hydroxyethylthiazole kinase [Opitutaceae bacterium]|nr:hydroxyethylthiazole kinase [Opitutaceae bacterium]